MLKHQSLVALGTQGHLLLVTTPLPPSTIFALYALSASIEMFSLIIFYPAFILSVLYFSIFSPFFRVVALSNRRLIFDLTRL